MSMDRCNNCSALVDTDDDCDFYQTDAQGQLTYGLCEQCRDRAEQEALAADPAYTQWLEHMEKRV